MSNAKWRQLFSVVNESNLTLAHCVWKLIGGDEPKHGFVPGYDSLGENYVGDCGALNRPFEYKVIEWLLIPYKIGFCRNEPAPIQCKTQELSHVIELLNSLGQFELETNENGIKIYGYKP
ncbi:hypothetical protein [Pseudoalteromonas ardens]|uniref:Uncharacterized protein n=1 Tax=Pseudoalteromonas rubra TaxID=43658 RepID=A0A0L0EX19_9GAMM|nr:hypothetical protein [Pseudoalteromonas sp. R96]KNC68959.1 hypothetical protein AC626_01635 [Pseudoalteromonas rubra]MDK1311087.1 hypothetical protein [Pseudoalteromonas sp. R96]